MAHSSFRRTRTRIAAGSAFVIATVSLALAGWAATGDVVLQTSDVEADHNYGVSEGNLHLTFGAGGEIVGYFRAVDQGRFIDVHGSLSGTKIVLYIGGDRMIDGTYASGKLDGYTLEGDRVHHFTGITSSADRL